MKICVIDDDEIFKFIAKSIITKVLPDVDLCSYNNPDEPVNEYIIAKKIPDIIFLDINFPDLKGWYFLDNIPAPLLTNSRVYIVSSGVSVEDKNKLSTYPFVKGLLQKPVSRQTFQSILLGHEKESSA